MIDLRRIKRSPIDKFLFIHVDNLNFIRSSRETQKFNFLASPAIDNPKYTQERIGILFRILFLNTYTNEALYFFFLKR